MRGTIPGTHLRIASPWFLVVAVLAAALTVFTIVVAAVCTAIRLVVDRLGLSPRRRGPEESAFDLVCLSQVPWQGMWQRNQHTMSRLARSGVVVYVRPINTIEAADSPRHLACVFGPEVRENLRVVSPVILWGDTRFGVVRRLNRLLVASAVRFALWRAGGGGRPVVLWFYFPRWDYLCGALGESVVVYDIQDDYTTWTTATPDIAERERVLLRRADVVFTGTRSLCRSKAGLHPDMCFVQNGVESAHFARARAAETEIPAALTDLPRPVIGYFGLIGDRIDTDILDLLAGRHPEWSIVLVGPVREEMCAVPDRPNVHLTGPADYADLPGYLKGFDVAIIPYRLNETTMDLNPTKLLEYLAGGRPVVSTAMHDVVELFGDQVGVARDAGEFLALTEQAVERPDPERIERNVEFAMGFTWDAMVEKMRSMVLDALDRAGRPERSASADGGGVTVDERGGRMRVLFSLPVYWPAVGGCECLTHELVRLLSARRGVEVRVITRINDQDRKVRAPLWFNTTCRVDPKGVCYREAGAEVRMLGQGRVSSRALYPVVRYHHRFPRLSTRIVAGAFRRQFREAARDCRVIHCIHNGLSWYGILSLETARETGASFVFSPTLHLYQEGWHDRMMAAIREGREFRYLPELHLRPRGYHDRFWLRLCREADALVTWTRFEKDFLVDLGIPGEKILPLRLGPIVSGGGETAPAPRLPGAGDAEPVVLFLGRNHELKGIEEILRAAPKVWERFPETRFVFVGPREGRTPEIFREHADTRIVVVDRVSEAEKAAWIGRCDIFCVPSLHESFGIVFLEAWYHRKPIIAADIPPVRELNPGDGGGILIRPTEEEIAGAILRLLEDPALRRRMGEWGRERVDTRYRWEDARDDLLSLYRSLSDPGGSPT